MLVEYYAIVSATWTKELHLYKMTIRHALLNGGQCCAIKKREEGKVHTTKMDVQSCERA